MPADTPDDGIRGIEALVARRFANLDWAPFHVPIELGLTSARRARSRWSRSG